MWIDQFQNMYTFLCLISPLIFCADILYIVQIKFIKPKTWCTFCHSLLYVTFMHLLQKSYHQRFCSFSCKFLGIAVERNSYLNSWLLMPLSVGIVYIWVIVTFCYMFIGKAGFLASSFVCSSFARVEDWALSLQMLIPVSIAGSALVTLEHSAENR